MKIIQYWKLWLVISALVTIPGLIGLGAWGLNLGIDFEGGTLIEVQFPGKDSVNIDDVKAVFEKQGIVGGQYSTTASNTILARTHTIDTTKYRELSGQLKEKIGETKELRFEVVGPTVSRDLARKAVLAVIFACFAIVLYIAWAFRTVPREYSSWKFGMSAIVALIHDLLVVIGIFAILGHYLHVEVDSLFITALLTVLGFSVHDTIVVFDRIRENTRRMTGGIAEIANQSIAETMARSINTSATVLFALLALLLFGGKSIFWFIFALTIGIVTGTYSSIFVASVAVVLWHKKAK
ncbi:MAG: protein translocase subunit SecF [Patescibacteria group bacterium]